MKGKITDETNRLPNRAALRPGSACVAQAHVSLHPNEVPTGSFATLDIRVPNEKESANTIKVEVQVPPGFLDVSTEYMPGWTAKVLTSKLAKPVQTDDGEVTEQVREMIWTGDGRQGKIPPGQFLNFPISTVIPGRRRSADLQDAAVLRQRRSRPLDRRARIRRTGAADRRHRRRRGAAGCRRLRDGAAGSGSGGIGSERIRAARAARARATAPARAWGSPP